MKVTTINNESISKVDATGINKEMVFIVAFVFSIFIAITVPVLAKFIKYLIIPLIMAFLFKTDSFEYLIFPLTFLDNPLGTLIMGRLTLLWLYLAIIIMKYLLLKRNIFIKKNAIVPLMVVFTYFIIASLDNGFNSIKTILVIFIFYQVSNNIKDVPEKLEKFYFTIITSSLVNGVGLAFNLLGSGSQLRAEGIGFGDPNYSSFICLIGLIAAINYKGKNKIAKGAFVLSELIFVTAIIRSGSRTGLILIVVLMLFHVLAGKGIPQRLKRASLILFFAVAFVYIFFTFADKFILDGLISRWQYTFDMFRAKDMVKLTASRSSIFSTYLSYYLNQNIFRIMFGGNIVGGLSLLIRMGSSVTHNVYLDYLMAFGVVGSVIIHYYSLRRTWEYYKKYKVSEESVYLAAVEIKLVAFLFGASLAFVTVNLWWVVIFL